MPSFRRRNVVHYTPVNATPTHLDPEVGINSIRNEPIEEITAVIFEIGNDESEEDIPKVDFLNQEVGSDHSDEMYESESVEERANVYDGSDDGKSHGEGEKLVDLNYN